MEEGEVNNKTKANNTTAINIRVYRVKVGKVLIRGPRVKIATRTQKTVLLASITKHIRLKNST